MADGGFFRGGANKPTASEMSREGSDIKRYPAVLWGYVINEPKVSMAKQLKVEFTVKFGASQNVTEHHKEGSGYRNCEAWGENDVTTVMAAVEHKETVVCFGEWRVVKYDKGNLTKKGKQKQDYHVFNCHAVFPMSFMSFIVELYKSPSIRALLEKDNSAPPDPFESDIEIDL